jgi:hypothetical protein
LLKKRPFFVSNAKLLQVVVEVLLGRCYLRAKIGIEARASQEKVAPDVRFRTPAYASGRMLPEKVEHKYLVFNTLTFWHALLRSCFIHHSFFQHGPSNQEKDFHIPTGSTGAAGSGFFGFCREYDAHRQPKQSQRAA